MKITHKTSPTDFKYKDVPREELQKRMDSDWEFRFEITAEIVIHWIMDEIRSNYIASMDFWRFEKNCGELCYAIGYTPEQMWRAVVTEPLDNILCGGKNENH